MNKQWALERLTEISTEYGAESKKDVPAEYKTVINDLFGILAFLDSQSKNLITLADAAVQEAREVEQAVMSTDEGRELVAHLKRYKPELFPVRNKRANHGTA